MLIKDLFFLYKKGIIFIFLIVIEFFKMEAYNFEVMRLKVKYTLSVLAGLLLASAILSATKLTFLGSMRAVFGTVFLFFIPGFAWSFTLFKDADFIERFTLSVVFSLMAVSSVLFLLNVLLSVKITALLSVFVVGAITIAGWTFAKFKLSQKGDSNVASS